MVTIQEIEMLATLVQRAGVNQIEAAWANNMLARLRAAAVAATPPVASGGAPKTEEVSQPHE